MLKKFLFAMPLMALLTCFTLSSCSNDDENEETTPNGEGTQNGGQGSGEQGGDESTSYIYEFTTYATEDQISLFDTDVTFTMSDGNSNVTRLSQINEVVEFTSDTYQDFEVLYMSTLKEGALNKIDDSKNYSFPVSAYNLRVTDDKGNVVYTYNSGTNIKTVTGFSLKKNIAYFSSAYKLNFQKDSKQTTQQTLNDAKYTEYTVDVTEGETFVDLGLSVKWASKNLEGNHIYSKNSFYAWGEVSTKGPSYTWDNYKWITMVSASSGYFVKYYETDRLSKLEQNDDAAFVNRSFYGGNDFSRLPTAQEARELINRCTWTWGVYNGENGYKVEGPNGNSIFLPAAGTLAQNSIQLYGHPRGYGADGTYWTSELETSSTSYPQTARCLCFEYTSTKEEITIFGESRFAGCSIRAVSTR